MTGHPRATTASTVSTNPGLVPPRRVPTARTVDATVRSSALASLLRGVVLPLVLLAWSQGTALAQPTLINGENHAGTISNPAQTDIWTFDAAAGNAIALSIAEIGADSPFYPWIRLIAPGGALVGPGASGTLAAQIHATAPTTGAYTVVVASNDAGHSATGSYRLTLAKIPGAFVVPDEGGVMVNGANYTAAIDRADLDLWTFTAAQGDAIAVGIGEIGADSEFDPWIRLFAPSGSQLGDAFGPLAAQINGTAPLTGTYTVLVASDDTGHDATGTYRLTLAKIPGGFVVPPGDEGGPMINSFSHPGTIDLADLDLWTFSAVAGSAIALSIGEIGGDSPFYPWIRLFGPTGAFVGSSFGTIAAQINITAPQAGSYTVLVASNDTGHDASGLYRLTVTGALPPAVVNPRPSDIDGDGKGELTVWRPTDGTWYWLTSASNYGSYGLKQWGSPGVGDVPMFGDIDGDSKADLIVWRASTGTWYWVTSSTGYGNASYGARQWGDRPAGDVPLVGDIDGDGKADLIVWRASTGTWYWLTSSSNYDSAAYGSKQWGAPASAMCRWLATSTATARPT